MSTIPASLQELAKELQQSAQRHRHRRLLLLSGKADACREQARQLLETIPVGHALWVGEPAPEGVASLSNPRARECLGGELDRLIYDAFSGFDPDAFGALAGTLRGGGLLLLLSPPLETWHRYGDPEYVRMVVAGFDASALGGRFLSRLAGLLQGDPWVVRCLDGRPLSALESVADSPPPPPVASRDCLTPEQAQAVAAIEQVALGHRRRPLVLSSDRGRGKSSALGIAAARLMRDTPRHLLVTASRRSAVDALFQQAMRLLPDARMKGGDLLFENSRLSFSAADHLLANPQPAHLLLVDEAAAIPTALLEGLLANYPRAVFATTVHGYEGTGRGFALRFKAHLDRQTPQWRELVLRTPIRWAIDDPLEPLLFRMLGLDCNPAPDTEVADATPQSVEPWLPESARLLEHEELLQQLFGLLVLAHYRTTPLDFRLLLDAPNLRTLLLRQGDRVVGVALLSSEGEFAPSLSQQIWAGRRRPKGHLLAQSLAAHVGIPWAPRLKGLRIVRIAIHPAAQRRGLGTLLLNRIRQYAREQACDYLGTSFGVSQSLFEFWHRNGLAPVRLGLRPGTSSGDHSILMIAPLSKAGDGLAAQAASRFARQLPALLRDPLRDLSASLAARLLAASAIAQEEVLSSDDWCDLAGFAFARRGYEVSLPAIEQLALRGLGQDLVDPLERELLVMRVLQHRPWPECARHCGLSGRGETETRLRGIMARLYQQCADEPARRLLHGIEGQPQ